MKTFTGWEYLLIDLANHSPFDLDKKTFEDRIAWAGANMPNLQDIADNNEWKEKPLYIKALQAIRKTLNGEETGHLVGFDAVNSGLQIMSAITGCFSGARATGLVDPDRRADAYTESTDIMQADSGITVDVTRKEIKDAMVPFFYGSEAEPKAVFGDDTPELVAFYQAMQKIAPGAVKLLSACLDSWQSWVLAHNWKLPDGFTAHVKVMQERKKKIEVDELGHSTFEYIYKENVGEERGVKNAANIIHSIDAYILRTLVRRCTYDKEQATAVRGTIEMELLQRDLGYTNKISSSHAIRYYVNQYERSGIADIVILPHLDPEAITALSSKHLCELCDILHLMELHEPFEIITVHDDFRCHPNNMNHLRMHYREILAELADSEILADILSQLYGKEGTYNKLSNDLSSYIRNSNYSLS